MVALQAIPLQLYNGFNNSQWKSTPTYDLIYSITSQGCKSTCVTGESNNIRLKHFES